MLTSIENLNPQDYRSLFKWVVGLTIVLGSLILRTLEKKNGFQRNDRNILILLIVFLIFLSGTRGLNIGTDTPNYYHFYYLKGIKYIDQGILVFFNNFKTDFFFKVIMFITFPLKNFNIFLFVVALIMNLTLYLFVRKFTQRGERGSSLLLFLTIASSIVFYNYQFNIIRNGLSVQFMLICLYYSLKKDYRLSIYFGIIALLFHRTAIIPLACIFIATRSESLKYQYFIFLYIICISLSYIGFGFDKISFLANFNNEDLKALSFNGPTTYQIGFRLDFVLYNSFFLFVFLKFSNLKNREDIFMIKYYILSSIIFFFNFNIPYSDRIGGYSWIIIPILLFNTIRNSFPNRQLYLSSLVALAFFLLNYVVLFP